MDTSKPFVDTAKEFLTLNKIKELINNPYVAGVIAILVVVYGSFMAPNLPESVAAWFANPIFKIVCIFLILFVHRINPVISIVLALAFIISIQTMSRYKVVGAVQRIVQQLPTPQETEQINQELHDELLLRQMEQNAHEEEPEMLAPEVSEEKPARAVKEPKLGDGLHPMNRPTDETLYKDDRVEDPNDPEHPGWKIMNDPNTNAAIYELNPPYAQKALPENMRGDAINASTLHLPQGGPTRYSAYHGYKVVS
jgi:hypothetical protein